ncbi:response regulator, partial [Streptomyces globisporus]|uniref:response regulator n=1 Tax=Streptomyces globisporus TaxID=1908 RepID=UPI003700DC27
MPDFEEWNAAAWKSRISALCSSFGNALDPIVVSFVYRCRQNVVTDEGALQSLERCLMLALVLDDAEMNNLLVVAALRPIAGCRPHDFTVPADALAFARLHAAEIGVVITDYDMPGMNGVEFIRAVRSIPELAHVPTVMVTSLDQRKLRREALEAGATDFLTKPADPLDSCARVTNLLALAKTQRTL